MEHETGGEIVEYGHILKALRIKACLSQEEIAEKLNRSRSCISKMETNHKVIDLSTFLKWVDVTRCQEVAVAMMYGLDGLSIINQILPMLPALIGGIGFWIL